MVQTRCYHALVLKESEKIWLDGKFVPWKDAQVHVLTHSLHYGLAAFEGIRCYKGTQGSAIFRLNEHVDRLFASAHIGLLQIPYGKKEIADAIRETVRVNRLDECYIRPIVFVGYGDMGLYVPENPIRVAIAAWPWGAYLGEEGLKNGIRAKVSSFTPHHVNVSLTRAKIAGYYVNSIMAKREVKAGGYPKVIRFDPGGFLSQGTAVNNFLVPNWILETTTLTSILEGIKPN